MGINKLCEKCRGMMNAQAWQVDRSTRDGKQQLLFLQDERHPMCPAESDFRRLHSTAELLKKVEHDLIEQADPRAAVVSEAQLYIHHNLENLILSAQEGCHLCLLYSNFINQRGGTDQYPRPTDLWGIPHLHGKVRRSVPHAPGRPYPRADGIFPPSDSEAQPQYNDEGLSDADLYLNICYVGDEGTQSTVYGPYERPTASVHLHRFTGQRLIDPGESVNNGIRDSTLAELLEWIEECTATHTECAHTDANSGQRSPKRLLRIESEDSELRVQLCEVSSIFEDSSKLKYTALSYCWGPDGGRAKLLQSKYNDYCDSIRIQNLPKTIRDAIYVTFALGVSYLWVDQLCIVQDDRDDWADQAPLMGSIYSGSVATLAATASSDSDGGLLMQNGYNSSCVLPLRFIGLADPKAVFGYWRSPEHKIGYEHVIEKTPLNERAWVNQERLLSCRLIHFSTSEIWWQCYEQSGRENGNAPVKKRIEDRDWDSLVIEYMKTKMTFESDKLIAFAGIAEAYGKSHGFSPADYVAGLWKSDLKNHLLWHSKGEIGEEFPKRSGIYTAPTWSWASLNKNVILRDMRVRRLVDQHDSQWNPSFKVTSVESTPLMPNGSRFGAIKDGHLDVQTTLFPVELETSSDITNKTEWNPLYYFRIKALDIKDTRATFRHQMHPDYIFDVNEKNGRTYVLPLCIENHDDIMALILEPVLEQPGIFRRLGMSRIQVNAYTSIPMAPLLDVERDRRRNLTWQWPDTGTGGDFDDVTMPRDVMENANVLRVVGDRVYEIRII